MLRCQVVVCFVAGYMSDGNCVHADDFFFRIKLNTFGILLSCYNFIDNKIKKKLRDLTDKPAKTTALVHVAIA